MKFPGEISSNHVPSRQASGRKILESKCQAVIEGEGKEFVRFEDISKAFQCSLVQDINIVNYDTVGIFFLNFNS